MSVPVYDISSPRGVPSEWSPVILRFRGFSDLSTKTKKSVDISFSCHGLNWVLQLYPGGHVFAGDVMTSVVYKCVSAEETRTVVKARFRVSIIEVDDTLKEPYEESASLSFGGPAEYETTILSFGGQFWGGNHFIKRSRIVDTSLLTNDVLTFIVRIQVFNKEESPYIPSNPVKKTMTKLFESADAKTADVLFKVKCASLFAHRNILIASAPLLAALCEGCNCNTPVPITDVNPDVFCKLLRYCYIGEIANEFVEENSRELLEASEKYGVGGSKIIAETSLVKKGFAVDTVSDQILFADGRNCALSKEAALDFFVANAEEVMKAESFSELKESAALLA